jgi:hypothetical protein
MRKVIAALDAVSESPGIVSMDGCLAPEHPFPAGLDDCMSTLYWMRHNADELGIDPDRIAVAGSSAGGGRGRFLWTPESNRFGWTAAGTCRVWPRRGSASATSTCSTTNQSTAQGDSKQQGSTANW